MKITNFSILLLVFFIFPITFAQPRVGFYNNSCPNAETIIQTLVSDEFESDPTITAALLRMHFHDCFVGVWSHQPFIIIAKSTTRKT